MFRLWLAAYTADLQSRENQTAQDAVWISSVASAIREDRASCRRALALTMFGKFRGFGVPKGGIVKISYDKNQHETEMRILTANGQIVTHVVRKSDSDGRLLEEKTLEQNRGLLLLDRMPAEQRALLSPEQVQEMVEQLDALEKNAGANYAYDSEGRLTKMQERNFAFERTTTRVYNMHGDKIEEREEVLENPDIRKNASQPTSDTPEQSHMPRVTVTRCAYKYDTYGNWTERITSRESSSSTTRRTLTYY